MKHRANQGMAIISVIMIMAVILILVVTFSSVAISEQKTASTTTVVNQTLLAADALSERGRMSIIHEYETGNHNVGNFLTELRRQFEGKATPFPSINGIQTATVDGITGRWRITNISPANSTFGWVEVSATASTTRGNQTVIRRIGLGDPDIFQLAMLTETVNCMFCHLRVNGDVGSLEYFRPGWGSEVQQPHQSSTNCWTGGDNDDRCDFGWNSSGAQDGAPSKINGDVYAARSVTDDETQLTGSNKMVNGTQVTGNIEVNSRSSKLPKDTDGDGIADFPPIKREQARANAKGQIASAATMIGVPLDSSYTGNFSTSNLSGSINQTYDGNLILVGTKENPIKITGDVYAEGDIIIKGVVEGIGALYSGRNIYFAGDVTLNNPPDQPGVAGGVCATITDNDACAKANITANKDVLRTGARGNVVVGDYTENDSSGNLKPWSQRQSADFYRAQFGFDYSKEKRSADGQAILDSNFNKQYVNSYKYYDTDTGDELKLLANGDYANADGTVIANTKVKTLNGYDAYSYSLRPGKVKTDGSFASWLSDGKYNELLGKETFDYNTWRWNKSGMRDDEAAFRDNFLKSIQDMGLTLKADKTTCDKKGKNCVTEKGTITQIWEKRWTKDAEVDLTDANGASIGRIHWSGDSLRVIISANATYETQVNQLDAFLYANQRIAGKTSMQAMSVQGGMIAKEIGVLAPGRRVVWPFDNEYRNKIQDNQNHNCSSPTINGQTNKYYVPGSDSCLLTLNYDYRLRNGGYAFNLVQGEIGKTLSWEIGTKSSEKVLQ
ncbi:MAG: hypothetical protein ACRCYY_05455 [Trueperaceae bacterium]